VEVETWDQRRGHGRAKRREMDSLWDHIEAEEVTLDTSGPEHEIVNYCGILLVLGPCSSTRSKR